MAVEDSCDSDPAVGSDEHTASPASSPPADVQRTRRDIGPDYWPILAADRSLRPFFTPHAGLLVLAESFDRAFGHLSPILRQTGAQVLLGAVNQEQSKTIVGDDLTTDRDDMVPIEKPNDYDLEQHELLARCIQVGHIKKLSQIIGLYGIPDSPKRECNNRQFSFVSMSLPGEQTAWAEAGFEERQEIHRKYRSYTHGMLWFLKTDGRVPKSIRLDMAKYGFCEDEWQDNDHWPWTLYIRAARRMRGSYTMTQNDITEERNKEDVIHMGSHFIDSHHVTRYAVDHEHFVNEGRIWQKGVRFDIPYRALTPAMGECDNLLVPVCVSASNVAFCAIRLEPTWMHLGEAAGIAAAMAAENNAAVQKIDVARLQTRLREVGIPLDAPDKALPGGTKPAEGSEAFVSEFFRTADTDRNGTVSRSEWSRAEPDWPWLFAATDRDRNGQVDRDEYVALQAYKKQDPDWQKTLSTFPDAGGLSHSSERPAKPPH